VPREGEGVGLPPGVYVPEKVELTFRNHGETGASIIEAYDYNQGPIDGFMGQDFKGYGEGARFTLADIQNFIRMVLRHPKRNRLSHIFIDFFGRISNLQAEKKKKPHQNKKRYEKRDRSGRQV